MRSTPPAGALKSVRCVSIRAEVHGTPIKGTTLMPGYIDTHVHFFQSGDIFTRPDAVDLTNVRSYKDEHAWIGGHDPGQRQPLPSDPAQGEFGFEGGYSTVTEFLQLCVRGKLNLIISVGLGLVGATLAIIPGLFDPIFNLFNFTNFGQPDGNVSNATGGIISTRWPSVKASALTSKPSRYSSITTRPHAAA